MSVSINIKAYSNSDNEEFQKHFNSVKFCIENELSFPKETSEFFKGKVDGSDLEDIHSTNILKYIENGIQVPLKIDSDSWGVEHKIKVSDIPKEVESIVVSLS